MNCSVFLKSLPFSQAMGASDEPCSEIYCGAFPESEPETQSVAQFLRSHKDSVKLYITIHSYSQMLLFPYSCTLDEAENHNEMVSVSLSNRSITEITGQSIFLSRDGCPNGFFSLQIYGLICIFKARDGPRSCPENKKTLQEHIQIWRWSKDNM